MINLKNEFIFKCKKNIALGIVLFTFQVPSWSYTKIGNGGFVILCNQSTKKYIEVLDVYEGMQRYHLRPNYPKQITDPYEKALFLATKANRVSLRDFELRKYILQVKQNSFYRSILSLNTQDLGIHLTKERCVIFQAAIQYSLNQQIVYLFDTGIWFNLLNENQKSILILHEAVYFYFLKNSPYTLNSEKVRDTVYKLLIQK